MQPCKTCVTLTLIASLLLPTVSFGDEEGVKVSGYFFGDLYGFVSHQNPEVSGQTGVWLRRVYVNFEKKFNPVSILVRFELNSPDSSLSAATEIAPAASNTLNPYLKNLIFTYALSEDHKLQAGIIPTPTWKRIEDEWGYRSVEKIPLDLAKFGSASETGLSLQGPIIGKLLSYHLLVGNGNGIRSETDKGKVAQLALASELMEGLLIEGYGEYNDKKFTANDSWIAQGFVQYKLPALRLGAQYDFIRVIGTPGKATRVRIASLYAVLPGESLSLFVRGDRVFDPNPKAKDIEYLRLASNARYTFLLAGVDIPLVKNQGIKVNFQPNLEGVIYDKPEKGETPKPVGVGKLTLFARF